MLYTWCAANIVLYTISRAFACSQQSDHIWLLPKIRRGGQADFKPEQQREHSNSHIHALSYVPPWGFCLSWAAGNREKIPSAYCAAIPLFKAMRSHPKLLLPSEWRVPDSSFVSSLPPIELLTPHLDIRNSAKMPLALERVFYLCCQKSQIQ